MAQTTEPEQSGSPAELEPPPFRTSTDLQLAARDGQETDHGSALKACDNLRLFNPRLPGRRQAMPSAPRRPKPRKAEQKPPATSSAGTAKRSFFLRTKLLPPRPAPELLSRPRLAARLHSNLAHPVTLVTANAGSGKTTLVADFVRTQERKFVWYQLDHTDADPFVFLGYITEGIKHIAPGFGGVMAAYLEQSTDELARQPERAVDVLLNEVLESVEQQFILVLDDYHHLGDQTPVHAIVDRLLQYLPDVMHVIIVSRDLPPLAIARLRSQSSLTILDRSELLFTDEETQQLFRKVFDLEITPEQLSEYRERTHGWITALQLVRQVAQRRAVSGDNAEVDALDLVEILRQSERDIFDYFAEEVFGDETENTQQLLMRIALLDRVDTEICSALYPEFDFRSALPTLVRRNVFLTVASDGRGEEYRLHPLFQGFLRRRFRAEIGRRGVAAEHLRCAEHYLALGSLDHAMRHLIASENNERAAWLISQQGSEWINSGALASLNSFVEAIPPDVLAKYPRAIAYQAEVSRLRGEYDEAQTLFRRAASLLQEADDAEGEAEALHSLATIARRRGDCAAALRYLDRAVELTDANSRVRIKCGNTRGLCLLATWELGAAEHQFRIALQAAEEQGDDHYIRLIAHNLGLPAGVRGDFGEALRWSRRMLHEDSNASPMPQEATAHLNIARFNLYRGDLDACERHLDLALERCQLFSLTNLRGEIFEAYGGLYRERGDATRAGEFYERAARAYDDSGIEIFRTELLDEQALLALDLNDLAQARAIMDRLAKARADAGDELRRHTATLTRARVMLAERVFDAVREDLSGPLKYFHEHHLYYYEAQACFTLTVAELATGNDGAMLAHLRRALDLAARYDYDYWLKRELSRNPELLAHPDAAELLPGDVRDQRQHSAALKFPHPQAVSVIVAAQPLTDLTINMLGPVEILRDPQRPLIADAWTTKRARDILCFIASRPHRRASKDTIIDTFWADADFDVVEKNFHPTVSHIRKALNSNQPLKQNFLLYRDGDYQLNSEFSYRIDIEEFDHLVQAGETARRKGELESFTGFFEQAIALYRGEFMQNSYDEWVDDQRAYYREEHLRLLETLTGAAQKAGDWARSLHLAQQILRLDPYREDVHCKIMRGHFELGNRAAVKGQFESLRKLLRQELGVEPAAETQRVFRELMK